MHIGKKKKKSSKSKNLGGVQLCMLGGCLAEEGDKDRDGERVINSIDHVCV